jgi:hypothetical protein
MMRSSGYKGGAVTTEIQGFGAGVECCLGGGEHGRQHIVAIRIQLRSRSTRTIDSEPE